MVPYTYENVSHAFQNLCATFSRSTYPAFKTETSRNGPVLRYPHPVLFAYDKPRQRVLDHALRDCNPFFHVMEALWMLEGRNDVAYLSRFVKQIEEYSDNGKTLHGAYGYRWRMNSAGNSHIPDQTLDANQIHNPGCWLDQLGAIVKQLSDAPDSRRVVLSMYSPGDLSLPTYNRNRKWKDVPCLAGDTTIWSPEGDKPIEELSAKFASGEIDKYPVYSVNPDDWTMSIQYATKVWCSGYKQVYKIEFDDGSSIKATEDHRFYRRGRSVSSSKETELRNLLPGDRVLATRRWYDAKGYERFKHQLGINTTYSNMIKTHRAYTTLVHGNIPNGMVVHHKDDCKTNNKIDNLELLDTSTHDAIKMMGDKNPMRRLTPEQHEERAKKQSKSLKETWSTLTPEQRKLRAKGKEPDNHRVISITPCGQEPVYDFHVPGNHTALIGTGVVAHNCNTHAYFSIDQRSYGDYLDMTVCNRSNDLIWGALGANAVHFSFLQEYLAMQLDVEVGTYYTMTNNLHVYTDSFSQETLHEWSKPKYFTDKNAICRSLLQPGEDDAEWTADLHDFILKTAPRPNETWPSIANVTFKCSWFNVVAKPLYTAYALRKLLGPITAMEYLCQSDPDILDVEEPFINAACRWAARRCPRSHFEHVNKLGDKPTNLPIGWKGKEDAPTC